MGEIQKILASAKVDESRGGCVDFELNDGGPSEPNGVIHIQNSIWRIEMPTHEFLEFALSFVEAGKRLRELKGL